MSKEDINKAYKFLGQAYYDARKNKSGSSYFYNELLEFPTTLKLLGNIRGKKVLDLGCGPGINAKKMQKFGAKVKGIDLSNYLIDIAKKEASNIEFLIGDVEKLPYKNGEFDIVVSSLVLGHIKDWKKTLSEVRRVLKRGGIFVFSSYNPVTEKFVKRNWFFRKYRELKGYFEEGEKKTQWLRDNTIAANASHYHKTYSTIVKLLVNNGFEIVDYEDCIPMKSAKKDYPRQYEKCVDSPHFCVWKVRKK